MLHPPREFSTRTALPKRKFECSLPTLWAMAIMHFSGAAPTLHLAGPSHCHFPARKNVVGVYRTPLFGSIDSARRGGHPVDQSIGYRRAPLGRPGAPSNSLWRPGWRSYRPPPVAHHARPRPPGEPPATATAARAPCRCALLRRANARHVGRCRRSPSRGASPARLTLVRGRRIPRSAARRAATSSDERTSGSGGVEAVSRPPGRPGSPHRAYRAGRPRGGFGWHPRAPAQRRRLGDTPPLLDASRCGDDEHPLQTRAPTYPTHPKEAATDVW